MPEQYQTKWNTKHKKQIPNPNYGKPRNTKKTVLGATCEICLKDHPMKFIECDHRHGGNYSLRSVKDIQGFFESICIVTENELRLVCKDCHGCLTYSAKEGVSFEQAKAEKQAIELVKQKKDKLYLQQYGISVPSNATARRKAIVEHLLTVEAVN